MERVKAYGSALVAAALALVCVIVGVLGVTVLRPPQSVIAEATTSEPLVMTRDGVLPLLAQEVTVSATAPSSTDEVTIALGSTSDVLGWIGTEGYTEIVGLEADRTTLKTVDHPAVTRSDSAATGEQAQSDPAQSGAAAPQSANAAQSAGSAQSGETSQSGGLDEDTATATDIAGSDMWLDEATGSGTVTLTVSDMAQGRSVIAAVKGSATAPSVTLTWAVPRANTLAIVSFVLAAIFAVTAALLALSRRNLEKHREKRAQRLRERAEADTTHTQVIPAVGTDEAEAALLAVTDGVAGEQDGPETVDAELPKTDAATVPSGSSQEDPDTLSSDVAEADLDGTGEERDADSVSGTAEASVDEADSEPEPDAASTEEGEGATGGSEDTADEGTAVAPAAWMAGRHGAQDGPIDVDPPERVPTDTGVIDVRGIRGDAPMMPSRRALREAREKGLSSLTVDGREWATGLVPVITPDMTRNEDGTVIVPSDADATAEDAGDGADTTTRRPSSWAALTQNWIRRGRSGKEDR